MSHTVRQDPPRDEQWRFALIGGAEAIAQLTPAWEALAADAATANIFYEPWAVAAALDLPEAAGLALLAGWRNDKLAGVMPLQRRAAFGAAVRNWDQRVRSLGEPLIRAGDEHGFWRGALAFLDARRNMGPYLRLSALMADSPSTRALQAVLAERGRQAYLTRRLERAVLHGGTSAADYKAEHIRGKVLKEHRRLRNRLADRGALAFERLAPDAPADPWIDDLFALELTGWKGRDGVAAAADPVAERCFRRILNEAHARGRLDFHRLSLDGAALSMLAVIEAPGDRAFQLKIAYDEAYAAFSPGVLLEMRYLDHALDHRRLAQVDSCARAGHPMIDRIWVDRLAIVSLAVPFDRAASRLFCAGQDAARRLARRWRSVSRLARSAR